MLHVHLSDQQVHRIFHLTNEKLGFIEQLSWNDHRFDLSTWGHFLFPGQLPWAIRSNKQWSNKQWRRALTNVRALRHCLLEHWYVKLYESTTCHTLKWTVIVIKHRSFCLKYTFLSMSSEILRQMGVIKWLSVTAMAGGGEQMRNAHACDVSLGARIKNFVSQSGLFVPRMLTVTSKWHTVACHCFYYHFRVNYNKNIGKWLWRDSPGLQLLNQSECVINKVSHWPMT